MTCTMVLDLELKKRTWSLAVVLILAATFGYVAFDHRTKASSQPQRHGNVNGPRAKPPVGTHPKATACTGRETDAPHCSTLDPVKCKTVKDALAACPLLCKQCRGGRTPVPQTSAVHTTSATRRRVHITPAARKTAAPAAVPHALASPTMYTAATVATAAATAATSATTIAAATPADTMAMNTTAATTSASSPTEATQTSTMRLATFAPHSACAKYQSALPLPTKDQCRTVEKSSWYSCRCVPKIKATKLYPLIISATPRSGTVFTDTVLSELGLKLSNDWFQGHAVLPSGIVSWIHIFSDKIDYFGPGKLNGARFYAFMHQVRVTKTVT